ncbi:MAG TPA: fibronectin type III domain-containing protein, partial [Cyclobacteriaceae bacterium]|nr:fibronectin type III domain-containing protein [Cyclobacteriaceae bacterium]
MKKLMFILLSACSPFAHAQTSLATWTFDALATAPNTPISISPTLSEPGQSLTASLFADGTNGASIWKTSSSGNEITSQAGTTLNDPRSPALAGNALTLANNSANGKSIVIKFSMSGLRDPVVTFPLRSTATGFSTHTWSWSTDGVSFTFAETYATNRNSTFYLQTLDFSSINELDGAPNVYLKLTLTGATAASGNNRIDNINLSATVPALPVFSSNFPKVHTVTSQSISTTVMLTGPATSYFVAMDRHAPPPSPAQIKAQEDGNENWVETGGNITCPVAATEYQFDLPGLLAATEYVIYIVAENIDGLQLTSVRIEVTTLPTGDHEPPTFLVLPVAKSYDASLVMEVGLNEPGKIYCIAVEAGATAPTVGGVIAGLDYENVTVKNEMLTIARAAVEYPLVLSGLGSAKAYDVYLVAIDTAGNTQSEWTRLAVTTADRIALPRSAFKVATYNLDFFASDVSNEEGVEYGPANDTLQQMNIEAVLKILGADLIALQEISNDEALQGILSDMPEYQMVLSNRWSHSWQAPDPRFPPQKIGFVYNTRIAELIDYQVLFSDFYDEIQSGNATLNDYPGGDATAFWSSGRLPFTARFDITIDGIVQR